MCCAGWALFACMVGMSAMAVPWVAHRCFTAFYRTHIIFALLTGLFALFHGFGSAVWNGYAPMSIPGATFWFIDLIIRVAFMNCVFPPSLACAPFLPQLLAAVLDCRLVPMHLLDAGLSIYYRAGQALAASVCDAAATASGATCKLVNAHTKRWACRSHHH